MSLSWLLLACWSCVLHCRELGTDLLAITASRKVAGSGFSVQHAFASIVQTTQSMPLIPATRSWIFSPKPSTILVYGPKRSTRKKPANSQPGSIRFQQVHCRESFPCKVLLSWLLAADSNCPFLSLDPKQMTQAFLYLGILGVFLIAAGIFHFGKKR